MTLKRSYWRNFVVSEIAIKELEHLLDKRLSESPTNFYRWLGTIHFVRNTLIRTPTCACKETEWNGPKNIFSVKILRIESFSRWSNKGYSLLFYENSDGDVTGTFKKRYTISIKLLKQYLKKIPFQFESKRFISHWFWR